MFVCMEVEGLVIVLLPTVEGRNLGGQPRSGDGAGEWAGETEVGERIERFIPVTTPTRG